MTSQLHLYGLYVVTMVTTARATLVGPYQNVPGIVFHSDSLYMNPRFYCKDDMRLAGEDACQIVKCLEHWSTLDGQDTIKQNPGAWRSLGSTCCGKNKCGPDQFYEACGYKRNNPRDKLVVEFKLELELLNGRIERLRKVVIDKIEILRRKAEEETKKEITFSRGRKLDKGLVIQRKLDDTHGLLMRLHNYLDRPYLLTKRYDRLKNSLNKLVRLLKKKSKFLSMEKADVDYTIGVITKIRRLLIELKKGSDEINLRYAEFELRPRQVFCGKAIVENLHNTTYIEPQSRVESDTKNCIESKYDPCKPNPCGLNQYCWKFENMAKLGWWYECKCDDDFVMGDYGCLPCFDENNDPSGNCEVAVHKPCDRNPCGPTYDCFKNEGLYMTDRVNYECKCKMEYRAGTHCKSEVYVKCDDDFVRGDDGCLPCFENTGYPSGNCEVAWHKPCDSNPCGQNEYCSENEGLWMTDRVNYECKCEEKFVRGDWTGCVKPGPCIGNTCDYLNKLCVPRHRTGCTTCFECVCKDDYELDESKQWPVACSNF